jgi:hypothetical protein
MTMQQQQQSSTAPNEPKKTTNDLKHTRTLDDLDNDALEGAAESPPLLLFLFGLAEILWGLCTILIQIVTSALSFFSTTQEQAVRLYKIPDVFAMNDKLAIIALVIAGAVEIIVLMGAMPMSGIWRRFRHIQLTKVNTLHAGRDVLRHLRFRHYLILVAFIGNVIGDVRFATLFTRDYVVVGLWVVMLTASSTLVFFDGWQRLWGALQAWKDYQHFHAAHYDTR